MLNIKEREPYIIIPRQRYNLSTLEPHNVMSGNFTFFVDFNLDSTEIPKEYAIVARPGMHMGMMMKTLEKDYSYLTWDFWTIEDGVTKWHDVGVYLHSNKNNLCNDRYFTLLHHDLDNKTFKIVVKAYNSDTFYENEVSYTGDLVDYSETPYNIGCGNYSKVVPEEDKLFSAITLYKLGLLSNIKYDRNQILKFVEDTNADYIKLTSDLDDLVFYFNFNAKNIYKVWDLSGHCNFIQKNLYIEEEDRYTKDEDFHKDYLNK